MPAAKANRWPSKATFPPHKRNLLSTPHSPAGASAPPFPLPPIPPPPKPSPPLPTLSTPSSSPRSSSQRVADEILRAFAEHPEAWTRVDQILEKSSSDNSKFFGLQILDTTVKTSWGRLPQDQREGIRNYVSNVIINICGNDALFRSQRQFLNKVNVILVQVLKHDWPNKWPSFIPDLVTASKVSEALCENR